MLRRFRKTHRPGRLRPLDLLTSVHAFQNVARVVPDDREWRGSAMGAYSGVT